MGSTRAERVPAAGQCSGYTLHMPALAPLPTLPGFGPFTVYDLRGMAPTRPELGPETRKKFRLAPDGTVLERDPKAILGVGLHQTSCLFGVGKAAIAAAGGDSIRAKVLRALHIAAPVTCFLYAPGPPCIVLSCPLRWHVNHGNALNPFTIGLEVEAELPGVIRRGPHKLSPEQAACVQQAIRVVVELGRAEGCPMTHIWAHRQTNGKKPGDPGEELWGVSVVEYARPVLGLKTEIDRFWPGSTPVTPEGRAIPREWDPEAKAGYL